MTGRRSPGPVLSDLPPWDAGSSLQLEDLAHHHYGVVFVLARRVPPSVTGAHSGIGKAIAQGYRDEGARVFAVDVVACGFNSTPDAESHLDVTDRSSWESVVANVLNAAGKIDVLVNNAGVTSYEGFGNLTPEEWHRVIAVNQYGPAEGMRAVAGAMEANCGGSIINISSILAVRAVPGEAAYHASKAALLGMTRNAAASYARYGIRVNAILPGLIITPMVADQGDAMNDSYVSGTPLNRPGQPHDLVGPAVFLATDASNYVTGAALPVDGGFLAV